MKSHVIQTRGIPLSSARRTAKRPPAATSSPPAAFVDDYLPALLAQASGLISSEFHQVVRAHGLTVSEWRVLATLAGSKPLSTGQLAQISVTQQPTVTKLLDRMVSRGQVERMADESDRRLTLVRITPEGARIVAKLIASAREHEQRVLEPFGLERAAALKDTLRGIIDLRRKPVRSI